MKGKKKGSALIMVLALTIFIMGILAALFTLAINTINQITAYNNINSTYYASEAGFQRAAVNIIKDDRFTFQVSQESELTDAALKSEFDAQIVSYKEKIKDNTNASSANDSNTFVNNTSSISYYTIDNLYINDKINCNGDDINVTKMVNNNDSTWTYTIPMILLCKGSIKQGSKDISKEQRYKFDLILRVDEIKAADKNNKAIYTFKVSDLKTPEIELNKKDNNKQ